MSLASELEALFEAPPDTHAGAATAWADILEGYSSSTKLASTESATLSASNSGLWTVLAERYVTVATSGHIEAVHLVSASALSSQVRLYDATDSTVLSGGVSTNSQVPTRSVGTSASLLAGHRYQLQARCVGDPGLPRFSAVLAAAFLE